jgi:glutamate dehydrogenase/leucine dehydrogenase
VQNRQRMYWTVHDVHQRLREVMRRATDDVCHMAREKKVDWRIAAYLLGVNRVAKAVQMAHPDF